VVDIIKVSAKSHSTAVAGAIAGVIREHKHADVQAIGAGAVNQATKAIAIARGYLELDGLEIVCVPAFIEAEVSGEERTAVRFSVDVWHATTPLAGSRIAQAADGSHTTTGLPPSKKLGEPEAWPSSL
jgi:stage V sporulation protein S